VFEQAFKNIDDVLRKEAGCTTELAFGLKELYLYKFESSRFQFKLEGTQANKADDPYVKLIRGSGGIDHTDPCSGTTTCETVEPDPENSIERYLAEGRYSHDISAKTNWNVGASWDRYLTDGSGVDSRYIGFAGIGNIWYDRDDLKFSTNYGISYTDRTETTPDPAKDDTFAGVRLDWAYLNKFGANVTYTNTWTINESLSDTQDYNSDMVNAVGIDINKHLAFKVSLQWLYNHVPPLRTVDLQCANPNPNDPRQLIACSLICVDNAGSVVPCDDPGAHQLPDEKDIRKHTNDFIFNTTLVITF